MRAPNINLAVCVLVTCLICTFLMIFSLTIWKSSENLEKVPEVNVVVDKKFGNGSWYTIYKKGDRFDYLYGVDAYYYYEIGDTIKSDRGSK